MTLTIEVSPETARRVAEDPEALRRAGELVDAAFGVVQAEGEDLDDLKEAISEGLAALKAGEKGHTPDEVDARMKAKFPFLATGHK
jgi:predicted transcriptional regulator